MGASQREASEILEMKRKYFSKLLSDDAIDSNIFRMFNIYDYASFWGEYVLSDTLFSSLTGLLFFDLSLAEVEPWQQIWDIQLPSMDEFLEGVLLEIEPIEIEVEFPELELPELTIPEIIVPDVSRNVEETRPVKAVVGKSRYGESYVDPPAVREFLRSAIYAFLKKDVSLTEAKNRLMAVARQLGIAEEVVEDVFNRLSMMTSMKRQVAVWDYAWWDLSPWGTPDAPSIIEFTDWLLRTATREMRHLWDVEAGGWWDESYWDMCYWTDDETPFRVDPETLVPKLVEYVNFVVGNFKRRLLSTPLVVANYQRARERRYPWRSRRLEAWAVPSSHRMRLESLTEEVVRRLRPGTPPHVMRLYKTAVLDMYGKLYGTHGWGRRMEKAMSGEEFKNYWIEKWAGDGLEREVLEKLYETIRPVVDALGGARLTHHIRWLRETRRLLSRH
ncbi:MAG: hypothetical protein DRJ96_02860 [Thermoprotei archaeon]|nr:MAG: hypothetical protein DRJ96_02860 [Thermoprotei archaeon]